jgi:hypothetical protein
VSQKRGPNGTIHVKHRPTGQDFKRQSHGMERERERTRESESQRESGEDEEKRRRNAERSDARVSVVLTLRPNNKPAIAYISDS